MYPKNSASPPRLAIGPVVQITDGAVQTSGVAVKVIPQGGTESAGAGTVAYSADGAVLYTPTQGETDYVAVVFVASKTGCIPAALTVVMSASNVSGYAGLDWSKITAATSTVALTGTTISTSQVVASVTNRVTANVDQWGGVAVGGMPMATYTQPAGFLAATFPAILASTTNITAATGIVLAPVTHTGARIPNVTLVDTTTVNTDMRGTDGAALASAWTATRAAYMDSVLLALNSNRTVQVTGSHHVAADLHELQPGVITAADFSANWLTAAGTAADYITELQAAIGTATNQGVILDRTAYALTVLAGACSDAQTIAETYVLALNGNTFTVDYSGLDASGNRGATTLSKV